MGRADVEEMAGELKGASMQMIRIEDPVAQRTLEIGLILHINPLMAPDNADNRTLRPFPMRMLCEST